MKLLASPLLLLLVILAAAGIHVRGADFTGADAERLRAELATQQMKADLREADLRRLNGQLADVQAALLAKDKELSVLKASATTVPPDSGSVPAAELEQVRRERDQARNTAATAETARAELRGQLQQAIEKYVAIQTDFATAQTERNGLQRQLATLSAGRVEEEKQRQAVTDSLQGRLAAAAAQTVIVLAERDALKDQLAAGQGELAAKLAATTKELATKENALAASQAVAKADVAARTSLAAERDSLQQQFNKLTAARLDDQKQQQASVDALKARLDATLTQAIAATKERDALKGQLAASQREQATQLAASAKAQAAQDKELAALQAAAKETQAAHAAALTGLTTADKSRLDAAQAERERLQKTLVTLEADRAATAARLNDSTKLADERAAATARALSDLEATRTAAVRLNNEVATVREQVRVALAAAAAAATENQNLKTRLALVEIGTVAVGSTESALSAPSRAPAAVFGVSTPSPDGSGATVAATVPSSTSVAELRVHVVASGDTLSGLSKKYYGSATSWSSILDANRAAIKNPDVLAVGTKLKIP